MWKPGLSPTGIRSLERATRSCAAPYAKGPHSFAILGRLNPNTLAALLPSFCRAPNTGRPNLTLGRTIDLPPRYSGAPPPHPLNRHPPLTVVPILQLSFRREPESVVGDVATTGRSFMAWIKGMDGMGRNFDDPP